MCTDGEVSYVLSGKVYRRRGVLRCSVVKFLDGEVSLLSDKCKDGEVSCVLSGKDFRRQGVLAQW